MKIKKEYYETTLKYDANNRVAEPEIFSKSMREKKISELNILLKPHFSTFLKEFCKNLREEHPHLETILYQIQHMGKSESRQITIGNPNDGSGFAGDMGSGVYNFNTVASQKVDKVLKQTVKDNENLKARNDELISKLEKIRAQFHK